MHMGKLAAIAAFLAALATPAFAQTHAAVTNFNTLCYETRGVQTAAFERAEAAGWTPLQMSPQTSRIHRDNAGRHTLMFQQLGNGNTLCMVSLANQRQRGDISADAQALFGHPPTYMEGTWSVWTFDNADGALTYMSNSDTQRATDAFTNGRAVVVRSGVDAGIDIIMYEYRPAAN